MVQVSIPNAPAGSTTTVETTRAIASPSSLGNSAPVRLLSRMYAAQQAPAVRASSSPIQLRSRNGTVSISEISTTPHAAASTATKSARRRDNNVVRTSGPRNSTVTATPSGRWASEP